MGVEGVGWEGGCVEDWAGDSVEDSAVWVVVVLMRKRSHGRGVIAMGCGRRSFRSVPGSDVRLWISL